MHILKMPGKMEKVREVLAVSIDVEISLGAAIVAGVVVFLIMWPDLKSKKQDNAILIIAFAMWLAFTWTGLFVMMVQSTGEHNQKYHQKACLPRKTVLSQEGQVISEYSILRPFVLSLETTREKEKYHVRY